MKIKIITDWTNIADELRASIIDRLNELGHDYYCCGCSGCEAMREDQARAEAWAEGAWLRHAESQGDPGFDAWEAARGVLSYEDARDLALAGA